MDCGVEKLESRLVHTQEVAGSSPVAATTYITVVREDGAVELRGPNGSVVMDDRLRKLFLPLR